MVKKIWSSTWASNTSLNILEVFIDNAEAIKSILGIEMNFSDVTLDFQLENSNVYGLYHLLILYSCIDHIHFEMRLKNVEIYNSWYFPSLLDSYNMANFCLVVPSNFLHLSHFLAISSSIGSSHFRFCLYIVWIICPSFNKKCASKSRGLYMLLRAARTPHCVAGLSFILITNPRVSSLTLHFTSSDLFPANFLSFRFLSFIPSILRPFWITLSTSTLLFMNLLKLILP